MNFTPIVIPLFNHRIKVKQQRREAVEATQRLTLARIVSHASATLQGQTYDYASIHDYEHFRDRLPVVEYPNIRPLVERMIAGESNILWPGITRRFAQSSGTSDGKSKFIPITTDSLRYNHYRGGFDAVAHYLNLYPDSRIFSGKGLILGGSFANEINPPHGVYVGDLSANLIDAISPLVNLARVPRKSIALMADWSRKLPALVEASIHSNITNISGVPSWFLTLLKEAMKATGADSVHDIWPNLEIFFHGGISMEPYRRQYAKIMSPKMRYLETYNASEGFFGVQTARDDRSMEFIIDAGVFYEFQPIDNPTERPRAPWEVEAGETYALIITSVNGLARYAIGDTVTITSVQPLKFVISGRTRLFINAFGEELMVSNAEEAMARTTAELHCHVANYTAAPIYADDNSHGRHQWLIEFDGDVPPTDLFSATLDRHLCEVNSDYQAKRSGSIFLDAPQIVVAPHGLFVKWLAATGKVGGQRKVPRLCPDRHIIESMLAMI